ncbi:MAG TPA: LytTR family DNA-binding domain-containing protein [Flavitalea sp.]|nr:LytTR family DNA-binding domain-containing protein [Flavitalea sp.]
MKIDCIIIEDLKVAADYLIRCCEKSQRVEVKGCFPDVTSALGYLNINTVDLLFLDVEMPGATGFELLDKIAYKPKVILTTSKEEYAYNAFQYNVEDFLKKPFAYTRFIEALDKVSAKEDNKGTGPSSHANFIFIKTDGKLVRLNNDDILFIESMGDYVKFVTRDKKYVTYNSLRNLEEKVNKEYFMKIHRSYIINLLKIDNIRENDLFINGIEIPISKSLRADVLKRLTIL